MKTIADLNALIPTLCELIEINNHEIGSSYYQQDEDGWGRYSEYDDNYIIYEEDGWCIEIYYKCCGEWNNDPGDYYCPPSRELLRAWGEVTEIIASHYNEETEEETEFIDNDLNELWTAIDNSLENIA